MLRRTLSIVVLIVLVAISLIQTACGVKGPLRPAAYGARYAAIGWLELSAAHLPEVAVAGATRSSA